METLIHFDRELFRIINGLHSPFFDFLMYWLSDKYVWIPLYAFLLFLIIREYRSRAWLVIVMIALLITATDQISVKLFKDTFMRLRPCHEPALEGMVRILFGHCGGKYGFISSHAANAFGIAFFSGMVLRRHKVVLPLMLLWATLVSYSRIYLGVHYPGDIIAGGLVGVILAYLIFRLFVFVSQKIPDRNPKA